MTGKEKLSSEQFFHLSKIDTRPEATAWRLQNSAPDSTSESVSSANEWSTNGTVYLSM